MTVTKVYSVNTNSTLDTSLIAAQDIASLTFVESNNILLSQDGNDKSMQRYLSLLFAECYGVNDKLIILMDNLQTRSDITRMLLHKQVRMPRKHLGICGEE